MKHKNLALSFGTVFLSTLILFFSCKKLNSSTELGGDLIPPVDNINTFDTIMDVQAFNDTFSILTDSTRYSNSYDHFLGVINNDPFFGKTDAKLYLELKPSFYKYSFINKKDSLHIDSVVLVLDYLGTYGDTTIPQTINVYEIAQSSNFKVATAFDSLYRLRENNITKAGLLGSRTLLPSTLNDSVKAYKDTTANQLRIRLDDSFGQRLLDYDSIATSLNGAYSSDSAFKTHFKGFALESVAGGNAIMGIQLTGANTKLAIYYKDDNNDAPVNKWDTAVAYFKFAENSLSASANLIKRDYNGSAIAAAAGITTPASLVYIQATPGSFARLKIPGLSTLNNRVVHRAELIMEQVWDVQDTLFAPPTALYVDAYDAATSTVFNRTIPYSLLTNSSGSLDLNALHTSPYYALDASANKIHQWRFNLTGYVQNIVNGNASVYDLRLYAPLYTQNYYMPVKGSVKPTSTSSLQINPAAGVGRVRLGGYQHPTQKMRLRIVYSKI